MYKYERSDCFSANAYADMAEQMRLMSEGASSETRGEFMRLAILYKKLASRVIRAEYGQAASPPVASYQGIGRLPLQETYFHYNRESVIAHVPAAAGVYALWSQDVWIYVGESTDIRARLLDHLSNGNECIRRARPRAFGFELIEDPVERIARQAALISDVLPIC